MNNEDLLYTTVSYIQYFVITLNGKEPRKEYIHIHIYLHMYIFIYTYLNIYTSYNKYFILK